MKLSMNEATVLEKSSLEKDLALCEKYGYDMIELRTMDCLANYLKEHTIDELATYFKTHHVKPLAFNTLCFFNNRTPEDYQKVLAELRQMCEWGQRIGCKTVITVPTVDIHKGYSYRNSCLSCEMSKGNGKDCSRIWYASLS